MHRQPALSPEGAGCRLTTTMPTPTDIQLLASILQGEAAILGSTGMTAVAAVFVARLLAPHYPDTVQGVAEAFYGRAMPSQEAMQIAAAALSHPKALLEEQGIFYYALSRQDRERLHLPPGDRMIAGRHIFQLHLYQKWPEKNPCPPS